MQPPTGLLLAEAMALDSGGVHLGYKGGLPAGLEEFNFPDHLLPGPVAGVLVLDGSVPRIDPYGLDFAVPLNADLLMELEALAAGDREVRLDMLQKMDAKALTGENNRARNRYMLDGMGLGDAEKETLWGGAEAPLTKRKAKKQSASDEEKEEESGSDVPEEVTIKSKAKAPAKGKQVAGKEGWAVTAKGFLMNADLGSRWEVLVGVWWVQEERAGFEGTPISPLKDRKRHIWEGMVGLVLDINPPWRGTKRPLLREAGTWASMNLYGQNGFLNILMTLKWWRDAMPKALPDWEEAIDDITWALIEMQNESNDKSTSSSTPLVAGHACGGPVPEGPENMQGMDVPAQGAPSQFSQEELDEINADPEADME
ncbi:hypothetical protein B0H14DRAFT_3514772 [Mycena olivaceomarginata]|nr:hypothetical protein B0H14DRAFT_3514772 [Mycena olivaceomarginata]